jgi:probable phosphoglycerate mutase
MHTSLPTRFCLIRHGETDWNRLGRVQGQLDLPLNDTGRSQAALAAHHLALHHHFDAFYSSDLTRTLQTAQPIADALHLSVQPVPALRERHYGILQGMTYAEMAERHPAEHARLKGRQPDFQPDGGESLIQLQARIGELLQQLVELHRGANVLIVTHGGVLDVAYRLACAEPLHTPRRFSIPNTAFNWICHTDTEGWQLERWADLSHLPDSLDEL